MRIRLYRFYTQIDKATLLIKSCTWEDAEKILAELRAVYRTAVLVENYSKPERQPSLKLSEGYNDGEDEQ